MAISGVRAAIGAVVLVYVAFHLLGIGILVWEDTADGRHDCHYLHSTGIHVAQPWTTEPCPKAKRY